MGSTTEVNTMVKIQFTTSNAALRADEDGRDVVNEYEVARLLRGIADRVESGVFSGKVVDYNGNVIGEYSVNEE